MADPPVVPNSKMFEPMSRTVASRRPAWKFVIEDTLVRILTGQFVVQWEIIDEIVNAGDYQLVETISHNQLGLVICIKYVGGT